jgi:predicted phosphodiesterase
LTRSLLLSDIHGNLQALKTVLAKAKLYDEVIVLGDLVDYGPQPGEVIDELKGVGAVVLRGNHDEAVAYGVDCKCGEATHWLSVWFRENITIPVLSKSDRGFLAQLPLRLHLEAGEVAGEAVHAAPRNPLYSYLYPWLDDEEACRLATKPSLRLGKSGSRCSPPPLVLVGHTHYQFLRVVHGAVIVNPGSTGQPRDGDPRAAYAILDRDSGAVTFHRIKYPVEETIRVLRGLSIPSPYIEALTYMFREARVPPRSLRPRASSETQSLS